MLEVLDAEAVTRWSSLSVDALRQQESEINDLNVYPVPDGDTGTNLCLTMSAAHEALTQARRHADGSADSAAAALRAMARGALLGARGNSGVITAQWLAGLASCPDERGLAAALESAAQAAYAAVAHPVEGTILTVARAAARAAAGESSAATAFKNVVDAAAQALARTPQQLPELAAAGVVDAGGRGLVVLLDALLRALTGQGIDPADPAVPQGRIEHTGTHDRQPVYLGPAYEVQFMLQASVEAVAELRRALDRLGDSLVIVGGGQDSADPPEQAMWRVHVHVDDAGAALEAGLDAGRPYQIQVTHLTAAAAPDAPRRPDPTARAVVVTAPGDGIAQLLADEGATVAAGNPSTVQILRAVLTTGAGRVAVLPTDTNLRAVAQAAADEAFGEGVKVRVIPTRSPVQALAALAVRDPQRRFEDDVIAMAEAAGACRSAEVTVASREALTVAGRCRSGDVLGLVEGEVNLIGQDVAAVGCALLDNLLASGGELVTLLLGADAPRRLADTLTEHVRAHWPFVEVHAYSGGQPHYPLLIGVE